jgi:hypothetical protein
MRFTFTVGAVTYEASGTFGPRAQFHVFQYSSSGQERSPADKVVAVLLDVQSAEQLFVQLKQKYPALKDIKPSGRP